MSEQQSQINLAMSSLWVIIITSWLILATVNLCTEADVP